MLVAKYPEIMTRNPNTGNPSYNSHWVRLEPADSLDWMTKLSAITYPRTVPGSVSLSAESDCAGSVTTRLNKWSQISHFVDSYFVCGFVINCPDEKFPMIY